MGIAFSCLAPTPGINYHSPAGSSTASNPDVWVGQGLIPQGFMDCTDSLRKLGFVNTSSQIFALRRYSVALEKFANAVEILGYQWRDHTPLFNYLAWGRSQQIISSVMTLLELGALREKKLSRHPDPRQRLPLLVTHALAAVGREPVGCQVSLLQRFKMLRDAGFDPERRDSHGLSAADYAASANNTAALDALEHLGVHLQAGDEHGITPLHWAAASGSVDALEMLLAPLGRMHQLAHAAPAFLGGHHGPLHAANVNQPDREGRTPLHWAMIHEGGEASLGHLLAHGADVSLVDQHGMTPIEAAAAQGNWHHLHALHEMKLIPPYDTSRIDNVFDRMYLAAEHTDHFDNVVTLIKLARNSRFAHRVARDGARHNNEALLGKIRQAGILDAPLHRSAHPAHTEMGRPISAHVSATRDKTALIRALTAHHQGGQGR
ncbi:MAG: hypothetical protein RIR70_978 [Pseudomonadota bacterium]